MTADRRSSRLCLLILLTLFAGWSSGCVGCNAGPATPDDVALRAQFGERAAQVLDGDRPFVEGNRGFVLAAARGDQPPHPGGLRASLPRLAEEAVQFDLDGLAVRVHEPGAVGEGAMIGAAIAYPRAGGTSYWTATADGYEEWLHLDAGVATDRAPVATWEIEGATLRQRDDAIELLDDEGTVRLRVTAPAAWAEGGEAVPARLTTEGATIALWVSASGAAVLVDPFWVGTGSLSTARAFHTQTLLQNGKVLAIGGVNTAGVPQAAVELYDPGPGTWSSAGSLTVARALHTATLLPSGNVLVTGGKNSGGVYLATTEIYDAASNTWSAGPSMSSVRGAHSATLLQSGKVWVHGGYTGAAALKTSEVYDPATNAWSAAASAPAARLNHTATLLLNGWVLVASGDDTLNWIQSAYVYKPSSNTWTLTSPSFFTCDQPTATLLQNGKVALAGGTSVNSPNVAIASLWLYDPATNTWSAGAPMATARFQHAAVVLNSGLLIVTGGKGGLLPVASTEIYDSATNTWSAGPGIGTTRSAHAISLLQNGKALLAGGKDGFSASLAGAMVLVPNGPNGLSCVNSAECQSGFCVDGVCCDTDCSHGPCDACSIAAGGAVNGTCSPINNGGACTDGSACTGPDLCQNGFCATQNNVFCPASDSCHFPGACIPATGLCTNPAVGNGAQCNDGNACTGADKCQGGVCAGALVTVCVPQDQCHVAGVCNPATGGCSHPPAPDGTPCQDSNVCTTNDTCQAGVCVGGGAVVCAPLDQCHVAGVCNGGCSNPSKPDGTACNDGNPCTQNDACINGVCTGANPISCAAPDACHTAGACVPATGTCAYPDKPNGTACNDGNPCTQTDSCQAGVCTGSNPVACVAIDACHDAGVCLPATGVCSTPSKANGAACNDGNPCTQADSCVSGVCTGGAPITCVALDPCHVAGFCNPATGACDSPSKPDGSSCNDGNPCTLTDTCQAGTCVGANLNTCVAADPCHAAGVCNPATGTCSSPIVANGTPCNDGNACSQNDTCQIGVCTAGAPMICAALDACHDVGSCDAGTGMCSNPKKANGTPCNDGSACTTNDSCQLGACVGTPAVVCVASDQCHAAGVCNPATGVCDNPSAAEGTACNDGDACTQVDTCVAGGCTGANPVVCAASDECHEAGTCEAGTGVCSSPIKPDGTPCANGACVAGVCASSGAGGGGAGGASSSTTGSSTASSSTTGSSTTGSSTGSGGASATTTGATTGTGATTASTGSGGASSSTQTSGGDIASGNGGCGCSTAGSPASSALWLGLGVLLLGRRPSRRRHAR